MTDLEKFKELLTQFGQPFDESRKNYKGRFPISESVAEETWIAITLDVGHCYAVDFEFNNQGSYLNCELYI